MDVNKVIIIYYMCIYASVMLVHVCSTMGRRCEWWWTWRQERGQSWCGRVAGRGRGHPLRGNLQSCVGSGPGGTAVREEREREGGWQDLIVCASCDTQHCYLWLKANVCLC